MSKGTKLETLLLEKDAEKLLRGAYNLNPRTLLTWLDKDEKNFDKLTAKVARAVKRNKKLVTKIRGEK